MLEKLKKYNMIEKELKERRQKTKNIRKQYEKIRKETTFNHKDFMKAYKNLKEFNKTKSIEWFLRRNASGFMLYTFANNKYWIQADTFRSLVKNDRTFNLKTKIKASYFIKDWLENFTS